MKKNQKFVFFIFLFFLYSCVGSTITSMAGNAAISEKGFEGTFDDTIIYTKIKTALLKYKVSSLTNLNVLVFKGDILLSGIVDSSTERLEIIKRVWSIKGVKKVHNEIHIGDDYSFIQQSKDIILSSKIKTYLLFNKKILSNNYLISTYKGIVYLIGATESLEEMQEIEGYIKDISGVKKLISFVKQVR